MQGGPLQGEDPSDQREGGIQQQIRQLARRLRREGLLPRRGRAEARGPREGVQLRAQQGDRRSAPRAPRQGEGVAEKASGQGRPRDLCGREIRHPEGPADDARQMQVEGIQRPEVHDRQEGRRDPVRGEGLRLRLSGRARGRAQRGCEQDQLLQGALPRGPVGQSLRR